MNPKFQRRSAISKTALIGNSQIPSALGQTITGALANIPFPFGIDSDGNYGYKKAGADTVVPFRSGATIVYLGRQTPVSSRSITIDVSGTIPNYQSLAIDNFFIVLPYDTYPKTNVSYTGGNRNNTIGLCAPSGRSYNSTTGIFTFDSGFASFHHDNGHYYILNANVDVYCVY